MKRFYVNGGSIWVICLEGRGIYRNLMDEKGDFDFVKIGVCFRVCWIFWDFGTGIII